MLKNLLPFCTYFRLNLYIYTSIAVFASSFSLHAPLYLSTLEILSRVQAVFVLFRCANKICPPSPFLSKTHTATRASTLNVVATMEKGGTPSEP